MREDQRTIGRAERAFREAFERLKQGKPDLLPRNAKPSQNNVAREAGLDPSALKKIRFPKLVEEIQLWIEQQGGAVPPSARQKTLSQRAKARDLRTINGALKQQRDDALGLLVEAEQRIVELTVENERLRAQLPQSSIAPLRPAHQVPNSAKKLVKVVPS